MTEDSTRTRCRGLASGPIVVSSAIGSPTTKLEAWQARAETASSYRLRGASTLAMVKHACPALAKHRQPSSAAVVRAGAHFLVSRPVYELDSLLAMVTALEGTEAPLLLSVTPLRSFEEADYLASEVPGVTIPPDTLRAMERAGRGAARAAGIDLAACLLHEARKLVSGVIVTAAEDDPAGLATLLAG